MSPWLVNNSTSQKIAVMNVVLILLSTIWGRFIDAVTNDLQSNHHRVFFFLHNSFYGEFLEIGFRLRLVLEGIEMLLE